MGVESFTVPVTIAKEREKRSALNAREQGKPLAPNANNNPNRGDKK
jgi:hypothetical protein